jgi:hypothetical protein
MEKKEKSLIRTGGDCICEFISAQEDAALIIEAVLDDVPA